MRFAAFVPGSLIVCAIAVYACSSSDETTPAADAGPKPTTSASSTSSSTSGAQGDDDDDTTSSSSSSTTGGTSTSSSSSTTGGTSTSSSSSTGGTPTAACPIKPFGGEIEEVEANDTDATAQAVAGGGTFNACGIATPGNPDFFSFTFGAGAAGFDFDSKGNANYAATGFKVEAIVNGTTYKITGNGDADPDMPVQTATPTIIKVTATGTIGYAIQFIKKP